MSEESPASGSGSGQRYRPSPAFSFPPAFQPSIIRSFQKDGYYLSLLRTQFADVVRSVFGSRFLQVHSEQLTVLVGVAYYVFSTYQGSQTLGEEYVGSRMVGRKQRFVSGRRRMVFVLSHVLLPYLLSRVYAAVRRRLSASNAQRKQTLQRAQMRQRAVGGGSLQSGNEPRPSRVDRVVEALVKYLPTIEDLQRPDGWLTYATALHLMAFYLGGRYYKLAQRFARVRYISIHPTPPGQQPPSYEVLGVLLGVQLGVKLAISLNRYLHRREQQQAKAGDDDDVASTAPTVNIDGRHWSHASFPAKPLGQTHDDGGEDGDGDESHRDYSAIPPAGNASVPLLYPSSTSVQTTTTESQADQSTISNLQLQTAPHESTAQNVLKCTLCMDSRQPHRGTSVVTECGHLFDWTCIMGWLSEKGECPLCRQTVRVNRVVPIYNV